MRRNLDLTACVGHWLTRLESDSPLNYKAFDDDDELATYVGMWAEVRDDALATLRLYAAAGDTALARAEHLAQLLAPRFTVTSGGRWHERTPNGHRPVTLAAVRHAAAGELLADRDRLEHALFKISYALCLPKETADRLCREVLARADEYLAYCVLGRVLAQSLTLAAVILPTLADAEPVLAPEAFAASLVLDPAAVTPLSALLPAYARAAGLSELSGHDASSRAVLAAVKALPGVSAARRRIDGRVTRALVGVAISST